jgi:PAS domain S-box-containing protein
MRTDEHTRVDDPAMTGSSDTSSEQLERQAAWQRGRDSHDLRPMAAHASEAGNGAPSGARTAPRRDAELSEAFAHAFPALADAVRDYAIFLLDPDGIITFWGEGARLLKWWYVTEAEGAHLRLLYPAHGSQDGTAEEHLEYAARHGEYTGEGDRVRRDESIFWAGVTLTALRGSDGALIGFAKVTRDLTARRAAQEALRNTLEAVETARAQAESASLAKSQFLATMSHEVRTPINAVIGYLDLLTLETAGTVNSDQRQLIARARTSVTHLLSLVSEVLDFSQIEADQLSVFAAPFRLGTVVGSSLALVGPQAQARQIDVTNAVSGFAANLWAHGDEGRTRQILVNLIGNAVKFTHQRADARGRIIISAGTSAQPPADTTLAGDGPWVYVRVEDTGVGIASDRLQPVFEPFVQGDMSLTRAPGGTGLGLAISRRLARLMGGDVTVQSEVNVGSAFFLWLPIASVESMSNETVHPEDDAADDMDVIGDPAIPIGESARGLVDLSSALLSELEPILTEYVQRVRADVAIPSARGLSQLAIEDHLATFLGDVASTLRTLAEACASPEAAVENLRDGSALQRLLAERHGRNRARLGWTVAEVQREFTVLHETLIDTLERSRPVEMATARAHSRSSANDALTILTTLIDVARRLSLESFERERV